MINDLKNYKGMMIILFSLLPLGFFFITPNISIIVISANYENDGSIDINIQYTVKTATNITTPSSELFDVTILSIKDDNGRVDDPSWGIGSISFAVATIHQIKPGIYTKLYYGGVYNTMIFLGIYPPEDMQFPSEITFVVSIGEDFFSSPFTAYLNK